MQKLKFTGFDVFFLALQRQYEMRNVPGNICHYVLQLDGQISGDELQEKINANALVKNLRGLNIRNPFLRTPHWEMQENNSPISVEEITAENAPNESWLANSAANFPPYFAFRIVRFQQNSALIFSWNHLLMDGQGAVLFLQQLFANGKSGAQHLHQHVHLPANVPNFFKAAKAKIFIDISSRPPVSGIYAKETPKIGRQFIFLKSFSAAESDAIKQRAIASGSGLGPSAYFLACSAKCAFEILINRHQKVKNFWIPVPKDNRKKGALGPILGNQLSFLFYRLREENLSQISKNVRDINAQLQQQIKRKMPQAYSHLMNFMKWLPLWLYYWFVRRKNGHTISTFLFTVAPPHPKGFDRVLNCPIQNTFNLPANPPFPGLSFAFMPVGSQWQLMLMAHNSIVSEKEFNHLAEQISQTLLTGE